MRLAFVLPLMLLAGCATPGEAGLTEISHVPVKGDRVEFARCVEQASKRTDMPVTQFRTIGDTYELVGEGGVLGPLEMWMLILPADQEARLKARNTYIQADVEKLLRSCNA